MFLGLLFYFIILLRDSNKEEQLSYVIVQGLFVLVVLIMFHWQWKESKMRCLNFNLPFVVVCASINFKEMVEIVGLGKTNELFDVLMSSH